MQLIPSLTYQPDPPLKKVLQRIRPDTVAVDLGAGGRDLGERVLPIDFIPMDGTKVCADVQQLPFTENSIDLVIGTGLIEHVVDDLALMREALRILKPGGTLHLEVPFMQNEHADPIDSRRFTLAGFEDLFRRCGFEVETSGLHIGPSVTMATLTSYYVALIFEGESKVAKAMSMGAYTAASIVLWPMKFLDKWLIKKRGAYRLAFGVYVTARVPSVRSVDVAPARQPVAKRVEAPETAETA